MVKTVEKTMQESWQFFLCVLNVHFEAPKRYFDALNIKNLAYIAQVSLVSNDPIILFADACNNWTQLRRQNTFGRQLVGCYCVDFWYNY